MKQSERLVKESLINMNCSVFRTGWPDFLVSLPNKKIIAIEVKTSSSNLTKQQNDIRKILKKIGLKVIVLVINENVEKEEIVKILEEKFKNNEIDEKILISKERRRNQRENTPGEIRIRGTSPRIDLEEYWQDVKAGKVL